jgi:hypothetical protein
MNFDHPELLLEGSTLNSCSCIVVLVVMVASSHLSYLNFLFYFSSSEACSSCFGPGCACLGGGLGAETLLRAPKFQRWAEFFLIHEQLVLLVL